MKGLKLAKAARERLEENRDAILETLVERHPSGIFRYMTKNTLERLMAAAVKGQASSIDTVVTTDIRRLIRLPNTLHGKTGWLTQNVPIIELTDYDPLMESIAFKEGTESIHIRRTPIIELGGEVYGPFEDETVELPLAVAMFILGRKAGRVVR
jgi:DNA primase small subunit